MGRDPVTSLPSLESATDLKNFIHFDTNIINAWKISSTIRLKSKLGCTDLRLK